MTGSTSGTSHHELSRMNITSWPPHVRAIVRAALLKAAAVASHTESVEAVRIVRLIDEVNEVNEMPDIRHNQPEEFVHAGNATEPELAAWEVAVERGLDVTRNDIRALLTAASAVAGRDTTEVPDA
jgi:hypothetical protein